VSSSLHGIIIAHSYGIPAAWIAISEIHGSGVSADFKFLDYYSSVGLSEREIRPVPPTESLARIVEHCQLAPTSIDKESLREALVSEIANLDESRQA
jgi:hypothetical protein